jgi:glycosyltransferase involved in cell wall biosynthesis
LNILYELTYATRGNSGIPRDTLSVAKILQADPKFRTDFILNPKGLTYRGRIISKKAKWASVDLGNAIRKEPGRSVLPRIFQTPGIAFQSISLFPSLTPFRVENSLRDEAFIHLKMGEIANSESKLFLFPLSYAARFARPGILGPFKIRKNNFDIFIQQQVDPIRVPKSVTHIIRLHDFLPVTHPQFFDDRAVKIFSKALRIMLKGHKKIWVMDSESSAEQFKASFGQDLDVRVIPCAVTLGDKEFGLLAKGKQILVLNTIEPRKRVMLAIEGFKRAKSQGLLDNEWRLIIAGGEGWQEDNLVSKLRHHGFGHDVIFSESPTDFEVKTLLAESQILLSTSAAEGFGLPPLEGMAFGCIPVLSDIPQHRETVGEHGLYFNGLQASSVAEALGLAADMSAKVDPTRVERLQGHISKNFSSETITRMWDEFLGSVVRKK